MQTLLHNIGELVSPIACDCAIREDLGQLRVERERDILIEDGLIIDFPRAGSHPACDQVIDCGGQVALPAFVDPHTHIPFGGSRADEFNRRLQGQSYMEIAAAGGGIRATVQQTRALSEETLFRQAQNHLQVMVQHGTATLEMKSGYGLDTATELKQLRVIRRLQETSPLDIKATFMGAHETPPEYQGKTDSYIKLMLNEMFPAVKSQGIADYCDIFCEKGVFSVDQSRRILLRAKELGFKCRLHADEIYPLGGAELAAEVGAVSADHLMQISDAGIQAMVSQGTVFTLLPATSFFLMLDDYAPARKIIDAGGIVALATDFNPGSSFTHSMPMVITLACLKMGLRLEEALNAATINAAFSLELAGQTGSLHIGKQADIILLDAPGYHYLVYNFGVNRVSTVIKRGEVILHKVTI